jgi:hypothetical protein
MPLRALEAAGGTPPRVLEAATGVPPPLRPPGNAATLPAGAAVAAYVGAGVVADRSAHLSPPTAPFTEEREREMP